MVFEVHVRGNWNIIVAFVRSSKDFMTRSS